MIYLDAQARTPLHPQVARYMHECIDQDVGANPHSRHYAGQQVMTQVDQARDQVAEALGAEFSEIIFTSGATEANNLALQGIITKALESFDQGEIITSPLEHEAVLAPLRYLQQQYPDRLTIHFLKPNHYGELDPEQLRQALSEKTILVTLMHAHNELGTIYPIATYGNFIKKHRQTHNRRYPLFHSDGSQAVWSETPDLSHMTIDAYSFSGHKLYGPSGSGGLYLTEHSLIRPLVHGGGQEYGLRSGTVNTLAIQGLGQAMNRLYSREHTEEIDRVRQYRDAFQETLTEFSQVELIGSPSSRLPQNIYCRVSGCDQESLLLKCDLQGLAVSSGSACQSGALHPSHTAKKLGLSEGAFLRISPHSLLSWSDISRARDALTSIISAV